MSVYKQSDWIRTSILYGEMSILDIRKGRYFRMSKVAKIMWESIISSEDEKAIISSVCSQLEGNHNEIYQSIQQFKNKLLLDGWIEKIE